jgi:hypothetical protein
MTVRLIHQMGIGVVLSVQGGLWDTLTGPNMNDACSKTKLTSLVTFKLIGKDRSGAEVVSYGFKLKQWFVSRGTTQASASIQTSWCNSIGYSMPRVRDLTNAQCTGIVTSEPECRGSVGAIPSSPDNYYPRRIGAVFFTEWGHMDDSFVGRLFCTSGDAGNGLFYVSSGYGGIRDSSHVNRSYAFCASVLKP